MPELSADIFLSAATAALATSAIAWLVVLHVNRSAKQLLAEATKQLVEAEAEQRSLFSAMRDVVLVLSRNGDYLKIPATGATLLFRPADELLGRNVRDVLPAEDAEEICRVIGTALATPAARSAEPVIHEYSLVIGKERFWFNATVSRLDDDSVVWVARDISAKRSLQDQLGQAQKMEAIGRLAGGVAHDFNNILTAILGHSDFLLDAIHPSDPRYEDASEIRESARRAEALTRQLLAFSRKQMLKPAVVDLNSTIEQTRIMLGRIIGEDIKIATRLNATGFVLVDPRQMEQVLINLSVNSRDAMPRGGTLTIATSNTSVTAGEDCPAEASGVTVPEGDYIKLTVTDTGCGMQPDVQARVFEPFFTTKELGHGTGLGLSTVHGIVTQSGGYPSLKSIPGVGTSFEILLPRQARPALVAESNDRATGRRPRGKESVLLVEDEPSVRALAARILTSQGYAVLQAINGKDAIRVSDEHAGQIDLILTDVVMPEMGASELVAEMRRRRPAAKVLLMSGYTEDEIIRRDVSARAGSLLPKPFTADELANAVRAVLDERSLSGSGAPRGPGQGISPIAPARPLLQASGIR